MIAELICKQSLTRYTASSRIKKCYNLQTTFQKKVNFFRKLDLSKAIR